MKKINNIMCVILFFIGMLTSFNTKACSGETEGVFFQTCEITENQRYRFEDNVNGLVHSIAYSLDINSENLSVGLFFPIRGIDNMYYIPVFNGDECVCVVTYVFQDDKIILNYSENIAVCINNLNVGTYYFEKVNNSVYIVGNNGIYEVENLGGDEDDSEEIPEYNLGENVCIADIRDVVCNVEVQPQMRDVTSRSLDTPLYANGGNPGYGYCWLACCASIMDYYGNTPASMSSIHGYKHSGHLLNNCPGGTITEARDTIDYYSAKYGTAVNARVSPENVQIQINSSKPIYSAWSHYNSAGAWDMGHAMVIVGYTYVDNTRSFTYKIMDPNCSNYVFVYTKSTDSQVSYVISGLTFVWDKSVYDFH